MGHAAVDGDAGLRHVGELDRVVRVRPDRVGEVLADLVGRDVERGRELDVGDVVPAEVHVHQAGDELVVRRVLVVLHALDEGVGAVADADDRDADLVLAARLAVRRAVRGSHGVLSIACEWDLERVAERREHEVVDVQLAAPGRSLELTAELRRHAQHDRAGRTGNRLPAAAAGGERNPEALCEERDGDVVQVRLAAGDLAHEGTLERAGHADQDARPLGVRSASSQTASTIACREGAGGGGGVRPLMRYLPRCDSR